MREMLTNDGAGFVNKSGKSKKLNAVMLFVHCFHKLEPRLVQVFYCVCEKTLRPPVTVPKIKQ